MHAELLGLLKKGSVDGATTVPRFIETVVSRVFLFEEDLVLKFYKRDNEWWNGNMRDIAQGAPRITFIQQDFTLNQLLNPSIYIALKHAVIENDRVTLRDPEPEDDELVIVMRKEQAEETFTEVLRRGQLTLEDFEHIGASFARIKQSIPHALTPEIHTSWYEQITERVNDIQEWLRSESLFSPETAAKGLARMREIMERKKERYQSMVRDDLSLAIDCNPQNLIYTDRRLRFLDACSPKEIWVIGTPALDFLRTGADIRALAGEEAYAAYLNGVTSVTGESFDADTQMLYVLYQAHMIGGLFYMQSRTDEKYRQWGDDYVSFIERMVG